MFRALGCFRVFTSLEKESQGDIGFVDASSYRVVLLFMKENNVGLRKPWQESGPTSTVVDILHRLKPGTFVYG